MLDTFMNEAKPLEKLNILCCGPTHERYEPNLCKTGHEFWSYRAPKDIKELRRDWNTRTSPLPDNYHLTNRIPEWVDFHLVLAQNKFGQYQVGLDWAHSRQIPLVVLEHTLPFPFWQPHKLKLMQDMRGDINVFISEYSKIAWNFFDDTDCVLHHMVDTDLFCPGQNKKRKGILSVANDYIKRDWALGFRLWQKVTHHLQGVKVVGDTEGLSEKAPNIESLIKTYQKSSIYLNTSLHSPIPMSVLEAMACGCAVVSTNTCMLPDIIEHGKNGFLYSPHKPHKAVEFCKYLQSKPKAARAMGEEARKTIQKMFNEDRFVKEWNEIFYSVVR